MSYICVNAMHPHTYIEYTDKQYFDRMRGNAWTYVLIILLVLMIFGVVSLGDVLGFIFYIFMGIILLGLILLLVFRYRINRARRRMYEQAQGGANTQSGSYRRGTRERTPEGEVTVNRTRTTTKVVSNDVGSYVEYEEIEEEETTTS